MRPAILPGGSWISRRIDIEVTDLPQPDSPTMPTRLAGIDLERHALDRADDAVGVREMGLQILDFEQRHPLRAVSPVADRARRAVRRPAC